MKFDISKILEIFNKLNDQMRYGMLAAVVFLILALDVFFLVLPQMASIANLNDQVKKISEDTQQVLVDKGRINLLKKNIEDARLQLESLKGKVRSIQEVPAVLSTISSVANEFGVKIDQLTPQKDLQETLNATGVEGKYYALPIVIKAHSGYHMFGRFLNKLENEDLSFIVKDFIVQEDDKTPGVHLYSLTIKIILVNRDI